MPEYHQSSYRGFSTAFAAQNRARSFATTDFETVKYDLLNHINTIKGERVMQPGFGTRIPLMAFEPLDPTSLQIIEDDLRAVFDYDPRVELIDLAILAVPDSNSVVVMVDLMYLELGTKETLKLDFPVGT